MAKPVLIILHVYLITLISTHTLYMYFIRYDQTCFIIFTLLFNLTHFPYLGYSNVHFETNPEDVYTTLSLNIARFRCKAKGTLISSGQEELLDVRFLRDNISLSNSFYPAHRHQYEVQGDNYYVVGVIIEPVSLSDNGRSYQCQARINGTAVDLFSDTAHLIVGGMSIINFTHVKDIMDHFSS